MDIVEIVRDQNRWWANPNRRETRRFSQRREVFDRLLSYLGELHGGRAAVLLGPRQVGKTTLLLQLVDELLDRDWPAANITFFDFSDERLVGQVSPRQIVELAPPGLADTHPRVYLLDEIQNALDWQPWLKSAVDQARRGSQPGVRFVVTGSAAQTFVDRGSLLVVCQGRLVLAPQVQEVSHGPQTDGPGSRVAQLSCQPGGRSGQSIGLLYIHMDPQHNLVIKTADGFGLPPSAAGPQDLPPPGRAGFRGQLLHQVVEAQPTTARSGHQKPLSSRIRFNRFKQRPRMKPIEPRARESRWATSL